MLGRGSLLAYLVHMTLRIVEIHRVLKPTGSFYLHCDPTASHYLKLVLDAVFCGQGGDFLNEVIWKRTSAHNSSVKYGPAHDVILFYTKSSSYTWNLQYGPYDQQYIDAFFTHTDSNGRKWQRTDLTGPGMRKGDSGLPWRDYNPTPRNRHWQPPSYFYDKYESITGNKLNDLPLIDRLEEMDRVGIIHWPAKAGGMPRGKRFLEDAPGIVLQDIWTDIRPMHNMTGEALGYPTQKPEALLERIIKASSNAGDVILDAYCGCGTTIAVAQRTGREWIGVDITYQSISLILWRFERQYRETWNEIEADILLDGVPKDIESAMALANRKDDKTRKEFEKWAVLTFSKNQARINEKKGADGGIDGIAYFLIDNDTNGKAIFQVKSRPGVREDLAKLNSDRQREKAEFGFLICTSLPTKAMQNEIQAAGKYKHPLLNREDDRLQVITVAELFDRAGRPGVRLDLPMARTDAVKSAAARGDADKQGSLL